MQDFKQLKAWQKSHILALEIYHVTEQFPKAEIFGITSQIRRSSVSIPSNIAEGCGRGSGADVKRFFQMGFGSACELEYQLILAHDLKFLDDIQYTKLNPQLVEVKKMLASLITKIKD
jgi:four helix bundle protein